MNLRQSLAPRCRKLRSPRSVPAFFFFPLCIFLLALPSLASAEGFALYEYGARGVALGGASMARRPDPSAVAINPALMTRLPGRHAMAGITSITPGGKMEWKTADGRGGSSELKDATWFIPHAYYTHQINDDWFFGVGEFTRFGLGFEYPHDWPGNRNVYEVSLMTVSINPSLAWKATDSLSLAAGVEFLYGVLDLKKRSTVAGLPSYLEFDTNLRSLEATAFGFNFAGHYQFSEQWAVGLQYRTPVKAKLEGDVEFSNVNMPDAVYEQLPFRDGQASAEVTLPDSIAGGIAWTPVPEFSIEAGFVWTRWSHFDALNIKLPWGLPEAKNPKDWKNTWRLNVGVEWDVLEWLSLRAGYVYDQSPMTEQYEDYLVPTADRHIYSGGLGFRYEAWTVDVAYAYIDAIGRRYSANDRTHTLQSKARASDTHIISFSLGYSF